MSKLSEWINEHFPNMMPKIPSPLSEHTEVEVPQVGDKPLVSEAEIVAGSAAVRKVLDDSGYGHFVSEDQSKALATDVLVAAARVR